jgi:hypothetical protein
VLVPPIKSKYSHGFGGFCGLTLFIKYLRMIREERPRIPPPSIRIQQEIPTAADYPTYQVREVSAGDQSLGEVLGMT